MFRRALVSGFALALGACGHSPPPHWAEGGAPLALGAAHWDRASEEPIDIDPAGNVYEAGKLTWHVDRAGRISDEDREPLAMLFAEGELVGPANEYLGRVGVANAASPSAETAWVAVMPDGSVTRFADDGERIAEGRWKGCSTFMRRTCTLVTHLVMLRQYYRPRSRVGVGVGIGVMVPY